MTHKCTLMISRTRPVGQQRGTILFVSLVILLLLTILGVTAMNKVTMEERMAGNLRDSDLSLQSAEAALRVGEEWLRQQTAEPATCSTLGAVCPTVWAEGALPDLAFAGQQWWTDNSRAYTDVNGSADLIGGDTADAGPHTNGSYVTAPPSFVIKLQKFAPFSLVVGHNSAPAGENFYLVSARGVGGSVNAETVLQSTFTKRF